MNSNRETFTFLCLMVIVIVKSHPSDIQIGFDDKDELKSEDFIQKLPNNFVYEMPIHSFARNILCPNKSGKILFFNAMSKRVTNLRRDFIDSFIYDLCQLHPRHDNILDRWVMKLFDTDDLSKFKGFADEFIRKIILQ